MSDLKRELEGVASAYTQGFNRQDGAGIAALYANGGVHVNAAGPRTDIEEFYNAVFKAGFDHQEAGIVAAMAVGADTAVAVGQYRQGPKRSTH
jgi:acylphosphatase